MKYIALILSYIFGFAAAFSIIGFVSVSIGVEESLAPYFININVIYEDIITQLIARDIGQVLYIIIFILLSSFLYSLYQRQKKKKKNISSHTEINGPYILYLRSFSEDRTTRKQVSLTDARSEEEILVEVLSDIAPVYAIGDPKDKKMPVGATRIYVEDSQWKETVSIMAEKAVAVVLRLGKTDSFWWEVDMVLKHIPLHKIMFIIPESKSFNNIAQLYNILLELNIKPSSLNLTTEHKSNGSISSILFFDNEGKPKTSEIHIRKFTRIMISYENIIRNALNPFRAIFGLSQIKNRTISRARLASAALIVGISVLTGFKVRNEIQLIENQSISLPENTTGVENASIISHADHLASECAYICIDDDKASHVGKKLGLYIATLSPDEIKLFHEQFDKSLAEQIAIIPDLAELSHEELTALIELVQFEYDRLFDMFTEQNKSEN